MNLYSQLDNSKVTSALEKAGFKDAEVLEYRRGIKITSGYPKPGRTFKMEYEADEHNVEEIFYWMVQHGRNDFSFPIIQKITDTHASSVSGSQFGDTQSRINAQQSSASNYMATIAKMLQDSFKLIRELRQIDERLTLYDRSLGKDGADAKAAEGALKDIWATLIEGGTQNASSVYGLAQKIGFTVLPDLFFQAPPMVKEGVDKHVDSLEFNNTVKNALRRKLAQFIIWKEQTYKELDAKRRFQLGYLRQHHTSIQMYMSWVKPYLRNLQRLAINENEMNNGLMIHAFESQMTEIEVLLTKPTSKKIYDANQDKDVDIYPIVLMQFEFRTRPSMNFHQKDAYQQKGPIHVGRSEVYIRTYAWTLAQLEAYKKYRQQEALELFAQFDQAVAQTLDGLKEHLDKYLQEAEKLSVDATAIAKKREEENNPKKEEKKEKEASALTQTLDLITSPAKGLYELMIEPFFGKLEPKDPDFKLSDRSIAWIFGNSFSNYKKKVDEKIATNKDTIKAVLKEASLPAWMIYRNYKKSHRMFSW